MMKLYALGRERNMDYTDAELYCVVTFIYIAQ